MHDGEKQPPGHGHAAGTTSSHPQTNSGNASAETILAAPHHEAERTVDGKKARDAVSSRAFGASVMSGQNFQPTPTENSHGSSFAVVRRGPPLTDTSLRNAARFTSKFR